MYKVVVYYVSSCFLLFSSFWSKERDNKQLPLWLLFTISLYDTKISNATGVNTLEPSVSMVVAATKAGLASTKTLHLEGEKALLMQLRWKPVTSMTMHWSFLNSKVLSDTSGQKQRKNPSRRCRDAIWLIFKT